MSSYLSSAEKQFAYYKLLGEKVIERLDETQLHWQPNDDTNSVALLAKHMAGNMKSRFTNFLTEDGEKTWRKRDTEFEDTIKDKSHLLVVWEAGWQCVFDAIDPLTDSQLEELVYIRNEGHTVIEALNRQLNHYAYHVGQMIFIGKQLLGPKWESLSIPKGQSEAFFQEKMAQAKGKRHFTDNK
ncbi:DUF1572 family protein [Spongiivirga citrea]|uniref:DUF1572 domain-containing protein n=1 Tax=Spongiivirga citrea TaxID=1481457 RepID=A0A6M0CPA6_9FLAO|nr:DUF1572 family protein [Spongiivirga citrea]NER17699.1 DUF1572 domain-containing protein [Spongiivirga citrea]